MCVYVAAGEEIDIDIFTMHFDLYGERMPEERITGSKIYLNLYASIYGSWHYIYKKMALNMTTEARIFYPISTQWYTLHYLIRYWLQVHVRITDL